MKRKRPKRLLRLSYHAVLEMPGELTTILATMRPGRIRDLLQVLSRSPASVVIGQRAAKTGPRYVNLKKPDAWTSLPPQEIEGAVSSWDLDTACDNANVGVLKKTPFRVWRDFPENGHPPRFYTVGIINIRKPLEKPRPKSRPHRPPR